MQLHCTQSCRSNSKQSYKQSNKKVAKDNEAADMHTSRFFINKVFFEKKKKNFPQSLGKKKPPKKKKKSQLIGRNRNCKMLRLFWFIMNEPLKPILSTSIP